MTEHQHRGASRTGVGTGAGCRGRSWAGLLAVAAILGLIGCKKAGPGGPPAAMAVQVVVKEAKRQPVTERLSVVGTLVPEAVVDVKAEIDGCVEELLFEEGQERKKGDLLARLDDTRINAWLAEAKASFQLNQANLARSRELRDRQANSAQEYDQAAAAFEVSQASLQLRQRELRDTRILAPFDGMMGVRQVSPGQVIGKNTVLATLVAMDPVKVEFNVPERFLKQLHSGQKVDIGLAAFPGEKFQGEVYFIAPQVDPATRTALVRGRVPNPAKKLKPGMFASLDLALNVRADAIVVPEIALLPQGDKVMVFVVDAEMRAQLRLVQTGLRAEGEVEIVHGLQGGEKVVVEGHQKLRPGGAVKFAAPIQPASEAGTS